MIDCLFPGGGFCLFPIEKVEVQAEERAAQAMAKARLVEEVEVVEAETARASDDMASWVHCPSAG